jgi:hypothetical protein
MMAHTMDKSLEDGRLGILEERQGKGRGKMKNERKKAKKIAFAPERFRR